MRIQNPEQESLGTKWHRLSKVSLGRKEDSVFQYPCLGLQRTFYKYEVEEEAKGKARVFEAVMFPFSLFTLNFFSHYGD